MTALAIERPTPVYEIGRPGWHNKGSCFETGTAAFFPQDTEEPPTGLTEAQQRKRIQFVCGNCPVMIDCFISSIRNKDEYGYWGGVGPTHRRRILKDLKAGEITTEELVAALAFRGPTGLTDAYRK